MIPPPDPGRLHAWFTARPGSGQIATPFALSGLATWVSRRNHHHRGLQTFTIADVGSGIGTTLACLAWWAGHAEIVSVESDSWCQAQARQNVGYLGASVGILYYDKLPLYMPFDFLVLDGPQLRPGDWTCLNDGATVFVEGGRRDQCATLYRALCELGHPFCWARWRPKDRSKGYTVVRLHPSARERAWFAGVRLREWWRDLWARLRGATVGKRSA